MTMITNRPLTPEQVAEQQRIADIFTPTGSLNVEAIRLLIGWADEDEQVLAHYRTLGQWGRWDQGTWGVVDFEADPNVVGGSYHASLSPHGGPAREEADKALLNGACQTAYCMAGQAVTQAGFKMEFNSFDWRDTDTLHSSAETCVRTEPTGEVDRFNRPVTREVDGSRRSISATAAEILGINSEQADLFFGGGNDIEDLKKYANEFADMEGVDLPYPEDGFPYGYGEDEEEY